MRGVGSGNVVKGGHTTFAQAGTMVGTPDYPKLAKVDYDNSVGGPYPENVPLTVIGEERMFYAFEIDSSNNALPKKVDFSNFALLVRPYIRLLAEYNRPIPTATTPYSVGSTYSPCIIVAYPILDPWVFNSGGIAWPGPRTTFTDNLLGGSLSGHINPASGRIDNMLAFAQIASVEHDVIADVITPIPTPPYSNYLKRNTILRANADTAPFDGGPHFNSPDILLDTVQSAIHQGMKCAIFRNFLEPTDPIYGIGFYLLTIADLQCAYIGDPVTYGRNLTHFLDPAWNTPPQYDADLWHIEVTTFAQFKIPGASTEALDDVLLLFGNNEKFPYFYRYATAELPKSEASFMEIEF